MDCLLQTPQIQLSEVANYITKYQRYEQTVCRAIYRLKVTRKKVNVKVILILHVFEILISIKVSFFPC